MADNHNGSRDENGEAEARAYLAAIIESSDDAIVSKNLKGIVTSWNQAAERMFGYSAAEAIGKPIATLIIPPDRLKEENEILGNIRQGKKIDHFQTLRRRKDGSPIEVSITVSPIRNSADEIIGASKIARDMGIAKSAERASAYLAAIVTSSDDAIISKNLDGVITSWNSAAERIYGYTAEEAIDNSIYIIIPPDREHEEKEIIDRLRKGEKIDHFETVRRSKDGRRIDVAVTISPIFDSQGHVIGASKVARDITERKKHQEELDSQRQWFEVTLASIGDAVIATGIDMKITYLNNVAEKLTGWMHQEALGKNIDEVFHIINEDSRQAVEHPLTKVIETGAVQGLANHTVLVARNGNEYSIEDAAAPIRLPDGKMIGAVLVFHDIGDRRTLEKELKHKAETLAEKDRRKDEFLAMLAHELRNPLAPISNALHIMRKKAISQETQEAVLDMATQQVVHMVRLLDDLLDVSRITYGKIGLRSECLDLCTTIKQAIDSSNSLINERNHALQTRMFHCPVWVMGDSTRLAQLFGNLLNNAAKYTRNGGIISLEMQESGTDIAVCIRDNGIGIAAEQLPYIFDMFTQVDSSIERSFGGLGIGLTLVKSIAELHGGNVEVRSEGKDKGTEFTVRLPMVEKGKRLRADDKPTHDESSSSYRILVVDDNEASAKTLGWMMEAMGHTVELSFTAKEALATARAFKPGIILLDIGMPDMNGYELCREMRRDAALKNATFIAQTGWGQEEHLQRSREAGFDFHLTKPIRFETLQKQFEHIRTAAATEVT